MHILSSSKHHSCDCKIFSRFDCFALKQSDPHETPRSPRSQPSPLVFIGLPPAPLGFTVHFATHGGWSNVGAQSIDHISRSSTDSADRPWHFCANEASLPEDGDVDVLYVVCSDGGDIVIFRRLALALPLIVIGFAGCGGGYANPNPGPPTPPKVSINPASVIVAAGSNTTFTAVFTPAAPQGGSLTWTVIPATGGTITSAGVYTASATAGNYSVVATWTSSDLTGTTSSGSATVEVLPVPQQGAVLNTDLVQASGAAQVSSTVQNVGITGQIIPSVISADPNNNVQVRSGFTPPVPCAGSDPSCP